MKTFERRRLLRLGALGFAGGFAGCTGDSGNSTPEETDTSADGTETRSEGTTTPGDGVTVTGSWPQFGYDARNGGYSPAVTGPQTGVEQVWQVEAGATVRTGPTVHDGTAYFGDTAGTVYAVDAGTGTEQWRAETEYEVDQPPLVADGLVFVQNGTGTFVFDLETGQQQWSDTNTEPGSGIVLGDGRLYVNGSVIPSKLRALDPETGAQQWETENPGSMYAASAFADGSVYVTLYDGIVRSFAAADGTREWEQTLDGESQCAPAVVDGTVYVGDETGRLWALDAADGTERWTADLPGAIRGSPAVANGTVYVGSDTGRDGVGVVQALDSATGSQQWQTETTYRVEDAVAVADGVVYCCPIADVLALDAATGERLWTAGAAGSGRNPPAVVDRMVFVCEDGGADNGVLYALGESGDE